MANSNSNRTLVPEAKDSLNQFKYEVASEVGVNLKNGYNGDISSFFIPHQLAAGCLTSFSFQDKRSGLICRPSVSPGPRSFS